MRILLLAPQPFYCERGTPIAVRLVATALARAGHRIDIVCYHEGEDVEIDGVTVHRIGTPPFVRNVPIGFSWKKLACDLALVRTARALLRKHRYDVVHAVEESVFVALMLRRRHRFALVYDMDSLMAAQLVQKWRWLAPLESPLRRFEAFAAGRADRVVAVCPALQEFACNAGAGSRAHLLPDVALPLPPEVLPPHRGPDEDLRSLFERTGTLLLYVGNLEPYQGVELLLQALAHPACGGACNLVVVGGARSECERLQQRADALGIGDRVRFAGPRPLAQLPQLLKQADIVCSPRLAGVNTPMKIYSYLASGRAIVATAIAAHVQVLDERCAVLVQPDAAPLADALHRLAANAAWRAELGRAAQQIARQQHGFDAFERRLQAAYRGLADPAVGHGTITAALPTRTSQTAPGTRAGSRTAPAAPPEP